MPIIIKDPDWSETENMVCIKVPLRGIHHSKTDIFYSELYIKVSFEQYFFEVFLLHPIKIKESKCTLATNHVLFELIKCQTQMWEKLEPEISKSEKQELKKRYIEEEHQRLQKEREELKNKKAELKRLAVREQMALDAKQRETIENIKQDEKANALKEMDICKDSQKSKIKQKAKHICRKNVEHQTSKIHVASPIPPPRCSKTLNVTFTPREFPTPCRESRLEEENEWLQKQAEARRSVGFISEDLRPEEHNPQFLKSKGDEFLRSRNYMAAVSAFSFGIQLNNKFADLYVGRAEAHLALGNYNKTVQDCSSALDLMKPEVPSNLRERAFCLGRRGTALVNLGFVKQGIDELKASLTLLPNEDFSCKLNDALEKLDEDNNDT
ncbi:hypothetical protein Zmor_006951 [Zophobas morio]|uniref:Dynein axonemal assembly factor 4 n=1 Tax=Zophobas morio TaxID=2755281 RepID=A0AA38IT41_9CUCU|nr:hypothetical protein Zmor_006951 [Zophobas morio]